MDKKYLMYGGIGAVVLVGGYLLMNRGGGGSSSADAGGSYYPPLVYGGSGGVTSSGDTAVATGTSNTDASINAMLASQFQTAQLNANVNMAQLSNDREIALAGYSTDLAKTKLTTNAAIEQSLAGQLGNIVSNLVGTTTNSSSRNGFFGIGGSSSSSMNKEGLKSVSGTIGFNDNGVISLDIAKNVSSQLNAGGA